MLPVLVTNRVFNFSAGPGMLPAEVLEASAQSLVDYQGKGFRIAECSHRGKEFDAGRADYVVSGEWSKKAASGAQAAHGDKVRVIASSESTNFDRPPAGWKADP